MSASSPESTPLLMSQELHGTTPTEQADEIAAAVHTFIQVHRCQPQYLVLHPDDFTWLASALQQQRAQDPLPEAQRTPIADWVLATLTRGSIMLADTEDPAWETPAAGS